MPGPSASPSSALPGPGSAAQRHPGPPLVVIGAGPAGLAAAAQACARDLAVVILEAGGTAGSSVLEWGHVRLFSPWSELIDPIAEKLLTEHGWSGPDPGAYPTGSEWVQGYLRPLADLLVTRPGVEVRYRHEVVGVAREGRDRLVAVDRDAVPFSVHVATPTGRDLVSACAVVDASGTWRTPNPLGGDGYPAPGEREHGAQVTYGIPDLTGPDGLARYAGKHLAVAGRGASAQNVLVAAARLAETHPGTRVTWLVRRHDTTAAFGGCDNDELEQRGALGTRAKQVVADGPVTTVTGFRTARVERDPQRAGALTLVSVDGQQVDDVDEIVVVTGFRPDHSWLSEVHLDLDGELSAPVALAPEIHPAHHSCGSVSPHGANLLRQPEGDLYVVGMKSYGRAPSFLTLTGYEQTRSVVAEIAGDHDAAARVELVLPDTGVCGGAGRFDGQPPGEGCSAASDPEPQVVALSASPTARGDRSTEETAIRTGSSCCS